MNQPFIDLILLSYGKFSTTTKPCLDSLVEDCANSAFQLTVIDNCSPDNSADQSGNISNHTRMFAHTIWTKTPGLLAG
jgi:hypothetical protein